jgi:hypothetical protein
MRELHPAIDSPDAAASGTEELPIISKAGEGEGPSEMKRWTMYGKYSTTIAMQMKMPQKHI